MIGQQPIIKPKNSFQYSSGTPLSKPSGFMHGAYNMLCEGNKTLKIIIPTFSLDSPLNKGHFELINKLELIKNSKRFIINSQL